MEILDGLYLCEGNGVSIPFCHEEIQCSVEGVEPAWSLAPGDVGTRPSVGRTPRNLAALLEESLSLVDMSRLKLDSSPSRSPVATRSSPSRSPMATRASPSRLPLVTSTPGMEVDISTDSVARQLCVGSGVGGESFGSLEQQIQGLTLEGEEKEEGLVEVLVCKITAKTEVVFTSCDEKDKSKVYVTASPLVLVNELLLQGQVVTMGGDIGGLSPQKQLLRELVVYPLSNTSSVTG